MMTIPGYVNRVHDKTPIPSQRSACADPLTPVAAVVRRHDRDRYQTALFAPAARREALFALYAFNYEIARVGESVTQPTLGHVRLQWWRENIAALYGSSPVRRHPIVEKLAGAVREYRLSRHHFDHLIDARENDLEDDPPANLEVLEKYAEGTSSRLIYLALESLGASEPITLRAARHVGIAFALSGMLRALPIRPPTQRPFVPADLTARYRLDQRDAQQMPSSPALQAIVADIARLAHSHLNEARRARSSVPRAALPALLPAKIADQSLVRLRRAAYDPFDPALQRTDPLQIWRLCHAMLRGRF
jgi:NADH dehydrogenase [ubiquinone] 1 alpha subcomplex assembly factor 6